MLTVYKQINPRTTVLAVTGRLDQQAILALETLIGPEGFKCHHLIFDLLDATWIDSFVLDQWFLWLHQMKSQNLRFSMVNPSPSLRESLNQAHISDLVPIFASQEEAIKHHEASSS